MKTFLPIVCFLFVMAGCSTVYRSGQTPDDVYFSPERPQQPEYVRMEKNNDRQYRNDERSYNNQDDDRYGYDDERYLRLKARNRQRWSSLEYDDWYSYSPYANPYANQFNPYNRFNNYSYYPNTPWNPYSSMDPYAYWNSYSYWNYNYNPYAFNNPYLLYSPGHHNIYGYYNPQGYYNPRGTNIIVVNPQSRVYSRPRTSNLRVYNNSGYTPSPNTRGAYNNTNATGNNNSNNYPVQQSPRRNPGSDLRTIFGNTSTDNNPSYSPSTRPSTSPGSSTNNNNSGSGGSGSNNSGRNVGPRRF